MTDEETTESVTEIKDPKAVLDALERAKADAKKFREELDALKTEHAETLKEQESLKDSLETLKADTTWQDKVKDLTIKSRLGNNADRLMKYMDLEAVTLNDEGDVEGLDEAVAKVKGDLPELFDSKRRVGGAADLYEKGETPSAPTGTQAQVSRIMRNRQ